MKTKWKVVSPYSGIEEDAPANAAGGGAAGVQVDAQGVVQPSHYQVELEINDYPQQARALCGGSP